MFSRSVQPDAVSLFSSTGSEPLGLFSLQVDNGLPSDSFVHLLNDTTSHPTPPSPASLISLPSIYHGENAETSQGRELEQTVLHIQSPSLRTTFIQCPPPSYAGQTGGQLGLGLKHSWLHMQVRNLGREWAFELGIVDKVGRRGIIRCSTFQVSSLTCVSKSKPGLLPVVSGMPPDAAYDTVIYLHSLTLMFIGLLIWLLQKTPRLTRNSDALPVLHLPLAFPQPSSSPLTAWSTFTLNLPKLVPWFASLSHSQSSNEFADDIDLAGRGSSSQVALPGGTYSHLDSIKVYATCRLRRVWLSESLPVSRMPWEFELYGNQVLY
ncbi:hypothetical protein HYDPIDRAFT_115049 [Hydnomerulius pinastri MD-312]|uniref:CFA20 domain-containing protein n=1 Tax=Hydnomerulius pinastri MD-312 TaxID=994086 RepID=A0A0C9V954_9AGAM|nr:hypothetical protein HYDPIDRAFT_115049 [Hydnomerulius pinastri MD-312]